MVTTAVKGLSRVQVGVESTRGTPVAATRRLAISDAEYRVMQDMDEHDDIVNGTLARTSEPPTITREHTEFSLTMPLDYDQFLLALESGLKGGVSPTTPGTGTARLWTYTPSVTADPAPKAFTLEYADSDNTNEVSFESSYGLCSGWQISGPEGGVCSLTMDMFGRKATDAASTGSLAVPTTLERIPTAVAGLFIDDTWAGLGTTQVTGQLKSFQVTFSDFIRPKFTQDGRPTLDFLEYMYSSGRLLDISGVMLVDGNSGTVESERAKKGDGFSNLPARRFVELQLTGSAFAAPDAAFNRYIHIQAAMTHAPDSMQNRGGDEDGLSSVSFHLRSLYDPTGAQDIQILVQNLLTAFP